MLYRQAIANAPFFKHSKVYGDDGVIKVNANWRHSLLLDRAYLQEFRKLLTERVISLSTTVIQELNILPFERDGIEIQITSHNHGEFFKPHIDKGRGITQNRMVTFVYYFHSLPKMFTGGQLLFLRNKPKPLIIEPDNNTIVFFDSSLLHAVHPISCPSKQFAHGRFTVNGWIRKKQEAASVENY